MVKQSKRKIPKSLGKALTFDDIFLVPRYSEVLPKEVSIKTKLTKNISLNVPFMSAAMDTVTESMMAIAMAQEGGIGILHKNMTIAEQASEVQKVKRSESGRITDPITLLSTATVSDALNTMENLNIKGIPIVDEKNVLVGIVTNRDLRSELRSEKPITSIMTTKLITGGPHTTLEEAKKIFNKHKIEKLPLVNSKGVLIGMITYRDMEKSKKFPNATKDKEGRLRVGAAVGVTADVLERVEALVKAGVDVICLDTAHGHSKGVIDNVKKIRKIYPKLDIIAGNVASFGGAEALCKAGVSAVKVGVGPGSICTTRMISGVGVPQLFAVGEAYRACSKYGIPVISDGGVKYSGDVVKALVFGADVVMAGGIFAGTDEAPGETIIYDSRKFKAYRGMGSIEAMKEGSKDRYFQGDQTDTRKLVPEGVSARVPYTGMLAEVLHMYSGGLRSGMGYLGAKDIESLRDAEYVSVSNAGLKESHPHDVSITSSAPNYSK